MPEKIVTRSRTKEYAREYARKWRAQHPERSRANVRNSRNRHPEGVRERSRRYYAKNRAKVIARTSAYKKKNKEKHNAHYAVTVAIWKGKVKRPDHCSMCGKKCKPQAHHHKGYALEHRFDVIWLCSVCHGAVELALKMLAP